MRFPRRKKADYGVLSLSVSLSLSPFFGNKVLFKLVLDLIKIESKSNSLAYLMLEIFLCRLYLSFRNV